MVFVVLGTVATLQFLTSIEETLVVKISQFGPIVVASQHLEVGAAFEHTIDILHIVHAQRVDIERIDIATLREHIAHIRHFGGIEVLKSFDTDEFAEVAIFHTAEESGHRSHSNLFHRFVNHRYGHLGRIFGKALREGFVFLYGLAGSLVAISKGIVVIGEGTCFGIERGIYLARVGEVTGLAVQSVRTGIFVLNIVCSITLGSSVAFQFGATGEHFFFIFQVLLAAPIFRGIDGS